VTKDTRKGVITNTYTYYAGGQLATEATPQWASSTVTLGYTSRLRTSLTLAQPTIGNWTHSYTWDSARRLDTLTGSSGSFDYDYIAAATSGSYASRLVKKLTVPTTSAGPNITNLWDTTGRLTETKLVNGGTTFNRHAYVLNAAHQRTLCAPGGSIVLPVATTPVFGGRCRHVLGIVHLPTKRAPRTTVDRGAVLGWRAHEDRSRVVRGRRAGGHSVPGSLPGAGPPALYPRG
jgi:hypothetical protein